MLDEAVSLAAAVDMYVPRVLGIIQLAVLAIEDKDWNRCEELTLEAMALLDERGLEAGPVMGSVHCLQTLVLSREGKPAEARQESRKALRLIALNAQASAWEGAQSRYLLARAHLMLGDSAAARMLLSEAQALLLETADAELLREQLDELWREVERSPLVHAGLSTLTTAELRVLQFLPTHLSFERISERLHVSRNTVKTQAIAGYRKLGVTSRAEAVERAYALGLIEQ